MPNFRINEDVFIGGINQNGNIITADSDFMSAVGCTNYSLENPPTNLEKEERFWRNDELNATDRFANVTDHPLHTEILAYRQELRDWPADSDFPDKTFRPVSPL